MQDGEPKRILVVGMHNKIGGVETCLINYYRNINKEKIQFDFINMYEKLCFEDEILRLGGNIYSIPNVKKRPIEYYKKLIKIIEENGYKIVHINMLSAANVLPVIAAKKTNVEHIIVHSHNSNTPSGVIRKVLDRINKGVLLKYSTDLWACSELAGKWMFGRNKEFKIINNAIDIEKYKFNEETRKKIRKQLNVEDKFVIGHIGRFSYQKNHEFLINVFYELQKIEKNVYLLLIGEGELKDSIQKRVDELKINNKVSFLGTTKEIENYLQAMDIFVLPSRFEGLPVTGIEAQANGIDCIFSANISIETKINNNSVFLPLICEEWVKKISELKHNVSLRRVERLIENYDIKINCRELERIYNEWR